MSLSRVVSAALLLASANALAAPRVTTARCTFAVEGAAVTGLHARWAGKPDAGLEFARRIAPVGWDASADTRAVRDGKAVRVGPLRVRRDAPITVPEGADVSVPDLLKEGHTLSQTFTVPAGSVFRAVSVKLPTWNTSTSGATLTLLKGAEVLASRKLTNVADNSWQEVAAPIDCGPGEYEVRLSEPVGMIGWWSSAKDVLPGGQALADGEPSARDRNLRVDATASVGVGSLRVEATDAGLKVRAELTADAGAKPAGSVDWDWTTSWTQAGYDCTPKAGVVFSRFFTNRQRYMPVEQLKRRKEAGLSFDACDWMEFEGTRDADVKVSGSGLTLTWQMAPREMRLKLASGLKQQGSEWVSELAIGVLPRADSVPDNMPRFELPDKALEADLNRFFWDRAFTYPAPAGPAPWFDMMAPVRCWYAGPAREGEMASLRDYPMTAEGYVHTWGGMSIGWPFPGPPYDTRHFDTNARFINGVERYYQWTGDLAYLRKQADRLKRAMRYQLETLGGKDGLIVAASKDVNGRHKGVGDNYWDILPFGHLDAYVNIMFFSSLGATDRIEKALGVVQTTDYDELRAKVRQRYNAVFWDDAKGRYIGCVDIDGARHDYGFTFVNLEAMAAGLASPAQVQRIYAWMEREPTSSGKADTYSKWIFAPRSTTIHNPMWADNAPASEKAIKTEPWWHFGWLGTPYSDQCQDGGAILFQSYFDLMARLRYRGVEDSWQRFMAIMRRYRMPDRLCGGPPLSRGEIPQQENPGSVGADLPFPESGMVPCYFLYGVMGIDATQAGLRISPRLPKTLSYAAVHGLSWRGVSRMSVRVTRTTVVVSGVAKGKPFRRTYPLGPTGVALVPVGG